MTGKESGKEGFGREVHTLEIIFYADDRLLPYPRLARIQEAMDALIGLFNRIVLREFFDKTVRMNLQTFCTDIQQTNVTYTQKMIGDVP